MLEAYKKKKRLGIIVVAVFLLLLTGGYLLSHYLKNKNADRFSPVFRLIPSQTEKGLYPAKVINLTNWKLSIPQGSIDDSSEPRDIFQPELSTYILDPWFRLTHDKKGVVFRAPVNAPTTSGSSYPRSELREMTDNGTKEAFWSSISGTHTLFIDQAITAVPKNKPDIVAGQIHGDDDDIIVVRLEDRKLFLARSKKNLATLDENYSLGKRFTVKFTAENGKILVYYNNSASPIYVLKKEVNEAYFKAGAYPQSNCNTEKSPDLCTKNNYGEVVIYKLDVRHD